MCAAISWEVSWKHRLFFVLVGHFVQKQGWDFLVTKSWQRGELSNLQKCYKSESVRRLPFEGF